MKSTAYTIDNRPFINTHKFVQRVGERRIGTVRVEHDRRSYIERRCSRAFVSNNTVKKRAK